MATGGGESLFTVTVNFEGNRTVLYLPKNIKVGLAVQKAAEAFKKDPRGLSFLYHGLEITDDMLVGDALAQANNVTVIHLVRSVKSSNTASLNRAAATDDPKEHLYGFCKTCKSLSIAREVIRCSTPKCANPKLFQRHSATPLNHFEPTEITAELLTGSCGSCGQENVQATVLFECTACDDGTTLPLLRQIRDNVHNINCMKCGLRKPMVFQFACKEKHTMCLECFQLMCKQLLGAGKFKIFGDAGYSVCCPGPGEDCQHTPVPDPHHFRVVDEEQIFYKKFTDMAIDEFVPPGDSIFCSPCKKIIDPQNQRTEKVEVTEPEGATPAVSGLKWYHRVFGIQPKTPPPRTRRRTSCRDCSLQYCVDCKQVWHEGDCAPVNKEVEAELKAYPIDPAKAKDSIWPEKPKSP